MRFRFPLFALLFIAGSLAIPHIALAGIPFFGPIIDKGWTVSANGIQCALGWGAFMTVINRIIELLITLAIVFVAPLMIAWAGFLMVVNQGDTGKLTEAKGILTHTIVGIVLSLSGWMIVDAVMAVLYNPGNALGTWSSLISSSGLVCLPQEGVGTGLNPATAPPPGLGVVSSACSIPALTPITDPLAQQMEGGQTVIWPTDPQLKKCVDKFIGGMGMGQVTSAYRPQAYQTHLSEIHDRWCTKNLKSNSDSVCSSLKSVVAAEVSKHGLSACMPVATNSNHTAGNAVDITGIAQSSFPVNNRAIAACLIWFGPTDEVHYTLKSGCTCN